MELNQTCFHSCDLKEEFKGKSALPHIQILSLTGFKPEDFKTINGQYNSLACYGEVRVAYCITRFFPLTMHRFGPWSVIRPTRDNYSDPVLFNENVEIPLAYCYLYDFYGISFVLCSTYTDSNGVHDQYLGGCFLRLYNSKKVFRSGVYELELHLLKNYKLKSLDDVVECIVDHDMDGKPRGLKELNHLLKVRRKQIRGELVATPLDQKTLSVVEPRIEELKRGSGKMFLRVKFEFSRSYPSLYVPVVFKYPVMPGLDEDARPEKWNPHDEMYFKMTRNIRTVAVDRERIPNKEMLERLKAIIELGYGEVLSEKDGDLIWQFRFYLANKFPETALATFLLSVRWQYPEQVSQAVELLLSWSPSCVSPEAVLELLTPTYTHPVCRRFAISRLQEASDDDIELYLYQLVQALRYENHEEILRSSKIPTLGADSEDQKEKEGIALKKTEGKADEPSSVRSRPRSKRPALGPDDIPWKTDLATFLIQRGRGKFRLANYLYWFLHLEAHEDTPSTSEVKVMFSHVLKRFMAALECGSEEHRSWHSDLLNQTKFVDGLYELVKRVHEDASKRIRKMEILKNLLRTEGASLTQFERPLPFPVDPNFLIATVDADSATLFKSTTQPASLSLVSPEGQLYRVIFKIGDDLRQDQVVLQMIRLMDVVLKKEMFDLHLTPYIVLAATCRHGFIQFVKGVRLSDVNREEGCILKYLQQRAPSAKDPLGLQPKVLETYIRSCAGYCVMTYLLGVGDRHMDNIMLTPEGQLFHIDFSFILGYDPKLMAPEVRLTKDMIEAMGGAKTPTFNNFVNICVTAFLSLRRHANLFLTMLSLVQDAGIKDIARDPMKARDFVKERFCLDETEERAAHRFASRIFDSIKAIVPEVMERIHTVMQYMHLCIWFKWSCLCRCAVDTCPQSIVLAIIIILLTWPSRPQDALELIFFYLYFGNCD
ncbi:phosphatidylinositol 3 kinase catalytic subunit [Echinococcus multilocularis]|uniref:Phosphatidylinositol 3-kinase catalytic subunit type 3 n=1 Tax=Echinococcus multilocularis TaxID=6211 RepID=A0A068YCH1_ECHMU|nr:phosphatidylinositol 3 kinase catalytic subunit [Echinococcus multilocularis]